jgi:hypothetical protein
LALLKAARDLIPFAKAVVVGAIKKRSSKIMYAIFDECFMRQSLVLLTTTNQLRCSCYTHQIDLFDGGANLTIEPITDPMQNGHEIMACC